MSDSSEDEYGGEYEDLNEDLDPTDVLNFPLFEHKNARAVAAQGEVKTLKHYRVKGDSTELYADQRSDYSITVQRLLWIDGKEKAHIHVIDPQTKQQVKQEMLRESTLVVLKIQMHSLHPNQNFQWMTATLALEDAKRRGTVHPEVQAWAPWRKLDRRNAIVGHREVAKQVEAGAKVGDQGVEISIGGGREKRISWDQTFFDEAHSTEVSTDGKKNGVTWFAKQNELQNQGVPPEIWVSALFSRSSPAPYLVKFHIYAHAGSFSEFANSTKRFFGLGPGRTKTFSITPEKRQIITQEGIDIMKNIDVTDFSKLRDKELTSNLNITWGPDSYALAPLLSTETRAKGTPDSGGSPKDLAIKPKIREGVSSKEVLAVEDEMNEAARARTTPTKEVPSYNVTDKQQPPMPLGSVPAQNPVITQPNLKLNPSGPAPILGVPTSSPWHNLISHNYAAPTTATNTEYARLVALEGRVADAEARITAQDKLILRLQRELIARDVQSAKIEQALHQLGILQTEPAEH